MISIATFAQALASVALLLVAAHLFGAIFSALRLPRVIGEIAGGFLLGPTLLGHFFPAAMGIFFASKGPVAELLPLLSKAGLVLLMYTSGAHLRSFVEQGEKRIVLVLAVAGIAVPFVAGLAIVPMVDMSALIGRANNDSAFLLVFATAIAIASIPVISRIMLDLGIMETAFARIVIATAIIDDIVLYVVLAVALGLVHSPTSAEGGLPGLLNLDPGGIWTPGYHVVATTLVVAVVMLAAPPIVRGAFRSKIGILSRDSAAAIQLLFLVCVTLLSGFLIVNPMFGALAAGMVAGRSAAHESMRPSHSISRISGWFFVPVYFALVGFRLNLLVDFKVSFFLGFVGFACIVKSISIYFGARIAGETRVAALNLAAALNARGGPGIVLASVAYDAKIINENFFAILVLTAVVTSLLAGQWLGRIVRKGVPLREGNERLNTLHVDSVNKGTT